ncbi:MAG: hypothetical protein JWQ04_1733, partial [Pedosphaera sp.]|nr:hypothetical protein [Pedosphaera sp.]
MKDMIKTKAIRAAMALGLLAASFAAPHQAQAQCCVTLNAPSNTASVVISAPSLLPPNDYSTADNAGFLVEQVLVGNSA